MCFRGTRQGEEFLLQDSGQNQGHTEGLLTIASLLM